MSFVGLSAESFIILQETTITITNTALPPNSHFTKQQLILKWTTFGAPYCYPAHHQSSVDSWQFSCGLGHRVLLHLVEPLSQQYCVLHVVEHAQK